MGKLTVAQVKFWLDEAKSCEDRQKKEMIQRNNYPFLIEYYEGLEKINPTYPYVRTHEAMAIINEFFPNTNALISEIMYQNPSIVAEPAKPEAEGHEELMGAALQYGFDKSGALIENRVALFDMLYSGYCAVEVDHLGEKGKGNDLLPSEEEMRNNELGLVGRTVERIKKAKNPEEAEEKFEEGQPPKEANYATNELTYVRRYNPLDVPLDWRAERLKDRRYNVKKVWLSKAEFDVKYPKFKDKVQATTDKFDFSHHYQLIHSKKVLVYEFQVMQGDVYWNIVLTPSLNEELDVFKRPYKTNGFNMKIGSLHRYGRLYPVSMAQINKKLQDEMNHYVKFMMEVAERNIPKYKVKGRAAKEDSVQALRSTNVNDIVTVDNENDVTPLHPTQVSPENKELVMMFREQKEKLWSVSESRTAGKANAKFMGELEIQEAGFQGRMLDIQEGLRMLIKDELEVMKDIVANFWDGEYFFKVTGGQKPIWYSSKMGMNPLTNREMVLNPLTDILIGDYYIKVDISSAFKPNKERRKKEIVDYLSWLTSPNIMGFLQMNNLMVNPEVIKKSATDFGFNAETLFVEAPQPPVPEGLPPEAMGGEGGLPLPQGVGGQVV